MDMLEVLRDEAVYMCDVAKYIKMNGYDVAQIDEILTMIEYTHRRIERLKRILDKGA